MRINTASVLILGSLLLGGCSSSNNDDSGQVVLPGAVPEARSTVSIQLQNLAGEPLVNVPVTVDDNDTDLLAKVVSKPVAAKGLYAKSAELVSDELGYISFELAAGTKSGDLTITVNDTNYFAVTKIFSLDSEDTLEILKLTPKPPAGETVAVTAVNDEGETVEVVTSVADQAFEEETVEVLDEDGNSVSVFGRVSRVASTTSGRGPDEPELTTAAEVLIPQGVSTTTASGVSAVGEVKVSAAIYQNNTVESIDAFPGGIELRDNLVNPDVAPSVLGVVAGTSAAEKTFISAGFLSLEVTDEDGNDITQFEGSTGVDIDGDGTLEEGILVTSLVPKTTINPETGELVAIGDIIPVWSYDDQTAKWTYDGKAKIFESANASNWRARFAATHLSYWNLDWMYGMCVDYTNTDSSAPIEFLTAPFGSRDTRTLTVKTSRVGNGYYKSRTLYGDGFVYGRLANDNVNISVKDSYGETVNILSINNEPYDGVSGLNFCELVGSGGNDVVLAQPDYDYTDLTVQVETSCSDSSLDDLQPPTPIPSTRVYAFTYQDGRYRYISSKVTDSTGTAAFTGVRDDLNYRFITRNRLYPSAGTSSYIYSDTLAAADARPYVVDIEQQCTVTTGSAGGT